MGLVTRVASLVGGGGIRQGRDPSVDYRPPPDVPAAPYETAEMLAADGSVVGTGLPFLPGDCPASMRAEIGVPAAATGVRVDLVGPRIRYTVWEGGEKFLGPGTFSLFMPHTVTARALAFAGR